MILNKKIYIYLILTLTLLIGYYFNEDPSGGGEIDFKILFPYVENLSLDFKKGFTIYGNNPAILIHSPIFSILQSIFLKFYGNLIVLNITYIIISSFLPFIFYLILKKKLNIKNDYIFYFSLVIFLSPYFRSSGIWLLGDNLSLIFFSLSIYFYLNTFKKKQDLNNYFLCLFFLILCSYIRYYYCLYVFYFFLYFYQNLRISNFFQLLLFGFILSLPALFYVDFIFKNYNFFDSLSTYGKLNIYSNILIILSIIFFYTIPIIFSEISKIKNYFKKNISFFLIFFVLIFLAYIIDKLNYLNIISFSPRGGGVFLKLFELLNLDVKLFLSIISFLSIIVLDFIFKKNRIINYFLLVILILSLPLFTFYQKYLDPLFFFLLFGLIQSDVIKNILIEQRLNLFLFFSYFFSFYLFSLIYHLGVI
tara:strand:- start:954 stop:2213 length:1260 start_codon:yes stop_codon:yes gene_type:complete